MLAHDEPVRLDSDRLGDLYSEMGESGAETVVCRALEELANRLSLVERAFYQEDRTKLTKAARGMIAIADQVGMVGLAQVARDVATCAEGRDDPALAATLARLVRQGDRSLAAIWDVQDLNG